MKRLSKKANKSLRSVQAFAICLTFCTSQCISVGEQAKCDSECNTAAGTSGFEYARVTARELYISQPRKFFTNSNSINL